MNEHHLPKHHQKKGDKKKKPSYSWGGALWNFLNSLHASLYRCRCFKHLNGARVRAGAYLHSSCRRLPGRSRRRTSSGRSPACFHRSGRTACRCGASTHSHLRRGTQSVRWVPPLCREIFSVTSGENAAN